MLERIIEMLNEIRADKGEDALLDITKESSLRADIGLDSFDLALLTAKIEDEFDVDVFEHGVIDKVGEIVNLVEK